MSSGIIEKYYTHTTEGHNKDYRMVIDYDALTLECHWGAIGGPKQIDRYAAGTVAELDALIIEKHNRRIKHGYTDMGAFGSSTPSPSIYAYSVDVAEMVEAERLGA